MRQAQTRRRGDVCESGLAVGRRGGGRGVGVLTCGCVGLLQLAETRKQLCRVRRLVVSAAPDHTPDCLRMTAACR